MIKVSIIMPIYNDEKYLNKAIESILKQTLDNIEIICINDGSTDNSLQLLEEYEDKYEFIKIFTTPNQGPALARNFGIKQASGEYIGFLDSDDIFIDEDAIEKMYQYGIENDADVVAANIQMLKQCQLSRNLFYLRNDLKEFKINEIISSKEYGVPYGFYKNIYKKSFLIDNNIYFPDYLRGEDPIFMTNVLVNTKHIYGVSTNLYGYNYTVRGGPNAKNNSYQKIKQYINHYKICFDILENNGFYKTSKKYKKKVLRYLIYSIVYHDSKTKHDVYNIFEEIFNDKDKYFKGFKIELLILNIFKLNEMFTK